MYCRQSRVSRERVDADPVGDYEQVGTADIKRRRAIL
jgi:hypothetical protein